MATYYFLNTDTDGDWSNSNNWYNDAGGYSAANLVPTSSDDVVIIEQLYDITSGTASVANMTIEANVQITATVSGTCTVQNGGYLGDGGTINGNVVCTTNGIIGLNNAGATINGNLTFYNNGSTENMGAVYVTGNLYLEANWTGSIESITVSFDTVYAYGYTGTTNNLTTSGNVLYSNYPNLYFYESGSATYDWNTLNGWWVDSGHTQKAAALPSSSQDVYIDTSIYFDSGSSAVAQDLFITSNTVVFDISISVSGTATFNNGGNYGSNPFSPAVSMSVSSLVIEDTSAIQSNATVNIGTDASFYDTSTNNGIINGSTTYLYNTTSNWGTINGYVEFNGGYNYGTIGSGGATVNYPTNRNNYNSGSITGPITYGTYPTFYWYGGSGWNDINAWWTDSGHTTQAAYVPESQDDVVIENSYMNTGATVNNATVEASFGTGGNTLTVNGTITFNNGNLGYTYSPAVVSASVAEFNNSTNITSGSQLTVSNYANFNDSSINYGTIYNTNAVSFIDSSSNASGATVSGDAWFYNSSTNAGTISGNATVYSPHAAPFDSAGGNTGSVSGTISYSGYSPRTVYFNGAADGNWNNIANWWDDSAFTTQSSYTPMGIVSVDSVIISSTVSSNSYGTDPIVSSLTMESGDIGISITIASAQFNNSSTCSGTLTSNDPVGTITFTDLSANNGNVTTLTGEIIFQDSSSNTGFATTGNGNINIYYPVVIPLGGTLSPGFSASVVYFNYPSYFNDVTSGTFDGNWNNSANWYLDSSNIISAGSTPTETYPGVNVTLQTPVTGSSGGSPTAYNLSLSPTMYITNTIIIVNGLATFEQGAYLGSSSTITGNALFKNTGYNNGGTISGTVTFDLEAAEVMILNGYDGTYTGGNIEFLYGRGVNGSSILGIV